MQDQIPPEVGGAILSALVAVLRVVYDKEETKFIRVVLEATLCGGLTVTAGYGIAAMGWNQDWTMFAGGCIGFLGSHTIKMFAEKFAKKRLG